MNADLSVAPEIAQLALPIMQVPSPAGRPRQHDGDPVGSTTTGIPTTGQLATALTRLAATPQRWWDLVRFDPDGPVRTTVAAPFEVWLLVVPPGQVADCHCELATLVAGEASEGSGALRQGRVRVHGALPAGAATLPYPPAVRGHAHASTGDGYSVSLHAARVGTPRSA